MSDFGESRLAPYSEPTTSRDAALAIAGDLNRIESIVYAEIRSRGENGATPHEVAEACGMSINTVRPRITEMQKRGELREAGKKRRTPSGRWAKAWRVSGPQRELFT